MCAVSPLSSSATINHRRHRLFQIFSPADCPVNPLPERIVLSSINLRAFFELQLDLLSADIPC